MSNIPKKNGSSSGTSSSSTSTSRINTIINNTSNIASSQKSDIFSQKLQELRKSILSFPEKMNETNNKKIITDSIYELIESSNFDINQKNSNGESLLMLVYLYSFPREKGEHLNKPFYYIIERLLEKGTDPNIKNSYGNTLLINASDQGNIEIVRLLLKEDRTNPNIQNNHGDTALLIASSKGYTEIVDLLLKDKQKINNNFLNENNKIGRAHV